ncbi:hypothetical protein V501_01752 [Pseudogymnoascus sp. VKM F-4519 (FW-2642)]|nr:hypothetical protein V501_01752 [Pseudogymnoascus sp. VKM F-4519 (FW-2642)]
MGGRKYNLNARTIATPLAAFCMATLLFVGYARTSITAAKRNAQMHREADGGQISWRNESLRRHGALAAPESKSTVKQLLGEKAAREEGQKVVARSEEEDRVREAARSSADGAISQPPTLLTLPAEVRCMIWEAVATCSGPILVCADSLTFGPLEQVARFSFAILPPVLTNKQRKLRSSKAKAKLTANPSYGCSQTVKSTPKPVTRDFYQAVDGAVAIPRPTTGYQRRHPQQVYTSFFRPLQVLFFQIRKPRCPFCLAPSRSALANGAEYFTGLRELRLQIRFGRSHGPANKWEMIRQCCDPQRFRTGGQHFGKLGQLMGLDALVCKDSSEKIADFAKWVCTQVPLRVFSKVKLDAVDVQFNVERIERSPLVIHEYQRGNDKCWCDNHKVDKGSIESCGFAEELKRRLMSGDS